MLIHWQSHQEYLHFLHETKIHLDSSQRTRLHLEFGSVREKLRLLEASIIRFTCLLSESTLRFLSLVLYHGFHHRSNYRNPNSQKKKSNSISTFPLTYIIIGSA